MTSAENVKFLTGVQWVTTPSWAMLKSGLRSVGKVPDPLGETP
jgi:hypothetical protein